MPNLGTRSDKVKVPVFVMLKKIIPQRFHYKLSNSKNALWGGFAETYYSQFGEDIVLSKLLKQKNGFYVDVGAHHPKRYSNTYLLYKRGWTGINVDPNSHSIALFNKARPRDTNLCVGVGAQKDELTYYQFSDPAVNSFNAAEAARWMDKSWIQYLGTKQVPVRTLADILSSVESVPHINLLSVDVEGMDLEVLQSNNWEKCKPDVIAVESDSFDPETPFENEIFKFLVSTHGYKLKGLVGPSLIFAQE